MDDTALAELIKTDPEKGLAELMGSYLPLVYSVVRGKLGGIGTPQDIEECVSDAFADLYRGIGGYSPEKGSIKALLCTIGRRRAVDLARKKAKEPPVLSDAEAAGIPFPAEGSADNSLLSAETRREVIRAVDALGEPDRAIVIRKYYLGESSKHIAEALGLSVSAVDTRAHRAVKKLRSDLEDLKNG